MSFKEMRCTSFAESSQSSHTLHPSPGAGSTNCSTVSSHKLTAPEHPAAPQPPSRPPWKDYRFRPIVHISPFAQAYRHTVLKLHYYYVREMKQIYFSAAVNNLQFPAHIQSSSYVLYTRACIVVQE